MEDKIKEYNSYIRKCEMLGVKMFNITIMFEKIWIRNYIQNDEPERLIKIPDFVNKIHYNAFDGITQRIKIVGNGLEEVRFFRYQGDKLNLDNLDTSNIKEMSDMFNMCSELIQLDLSKLDTRNVTKMDGMFNRCKK